MVKGQESHQRRGQNKGDPGSAPNSRHGWCLPPYRKCPAGVHSDGSSSLRLKYRTRAAELNPPLVELHRAVPPRRKVYGRKRKLWADGGGRGSFSRKECRKGRLVGDAGLEPATFSV